MKSAFDLDAIGDAMLKARNPEDNKYCFDTKTRTIVELADIEDGDPERFLQVYPIELGDEFGWMTDFTELVCGSRASDELRRILEAAKAQLHQSLARYPEEAMYWHHFAQQKKREEAAFWLEESGVIENASAAFAAFS